MNPIFRYATILVILMLLSIHPLILSVDGMSGRGHNHNPVVELAEKDARRDGGHQAGLRWFAYGAGCWVFAVIHASVNSPPVPSDRLLGKSPEYVSTYTDAYKRSIKTRRVEMSAIGWGISLGAVLWLWNIFTD